MNFQKVGYILEEEKNPFPSPKFRKQSPSLARWLFESPGNCSSSPVLRPYVEINIVAILLSNHQKLSVLSRETWSSGKKSQLVSEFFCTIFAYDTAIYSTW